MMMWDDFDTNVQCDELYCHEDDDYPFEELSKEDLKDFLDRVAAYEEDTYEDDDLPF